MLKALLNFQQCSGVSGRWQAGDVISWQMTHYGGTLFATMLDPIVEHGVQQITHLDNYVDRLTE